MTDRLDGAAWIRPHEPVVAEAGARPAHVLGTGFELAGDIRDATLEVTAHGLVEVFVNGHRVGDDELVPGFTAYRKRLQVFSYPVADVLRPGPNRVEVLLSDGWFRGRHGFERRPDGFGTETALLLRLDVVDADGTSTRVVTDADWRSRPSHVTRADLMDGQSVDFRLLDDPDRADWAPVTVASGALYDDRSRLVDATAPPVRRVETLAPASVTRPRPGTAVIDVGQEINGWMRLADLGPRDTHLTLTHGEVLDDDGLVSTENLRAFVFATGERLPAGQVDEVISAGRDGDVFEPRHTTHGFRYVQIDGVPDDWDAAGARAIVVHTDLRPVGAFACSDERLNRLHEVVRWSFRGNACDIPTDCPQRERSGFTGDWQVFVDTAALLYDVQGFSAKWLADLAADQWADGRVPTVIPNPAGDGPSGVVFEDLSAGSAGWGDAAVLVPWELWRLYGDLAVLRRRLPSMLAWVRYAAGAAASARHPDRAPRARCRRRTRSSSGTRGSTSANGSSPAFRRSRIRRSITASSRQPSCTGRRPRRRPLSSSATPTPRPSARASPTAPARHGGRSTSRRPAGWRGVAGELRPRPRLRAVRPRAARRRCRPSRRARAPERRPPRHGLPQHRPAAAGPRRPRARRRRVPHAARHRRAVLARDARARCDHDVGVVGRGRRRRARPRFPEPLQQGRSASFLYTHVVGIRLDPGPDAATPAIAACASRRCRAAASRGPRVPRDPARPARVGVAARRGALPLEVEVPEGCTASIELPDGTRHVVGEGAHAFRHPVA